MPKWSSASGQDQRSRLDDVPSLLPGESPEPELPDDAAHWVAVYEELTGFLRQLDCESPEIATRYQLRLDHWRRARAHQVADE